MELTDMIDNARNALAEVNPKTLSPVDRIAYATAVGQLSTAASTRHAVEALGLLVETEVARTHHVLRIAEKIDPA